MLEDSFKCIKKMNEEVELYKKWEGIRTIFKDVLDSGSFRSDIKFTTHNYSVHCINIYKNIDKLISWNTDREPTAYEMFFLNVAVILHDIFMSLDPKKRDIHSIEAYELIKKQINDYDRNVINSYLRPSEADVVADIILAHSDIKKENGKEDTIKYLLDKYVDDTDYENCRVCHLAVLLRLADEMDVTKDRINRPMNEMNFDIEDKNDRESRIHFRKLELVNKILVDKRKNDQLLLVIEDYKYMELNDDDSDDIYLSEVKNKIESELLNVDRVYTGFKQEICPYNRFLKVKIKSSDAEREKKINDKAEELKKKENSIV